MDAEYIVAIVAGSIFLLLFLVFIILYAQRRKREKSQKLRLEQMYSDKNLVQMKYDFLVYDEETEHAIPDHPENGQMSFNDIAPDAMPENDSDVFQTVDTDGLEEIVGTYKPE